MTDSEKLDLLIGKAQSMDDGMQRMKLNMQEMMTDMKGLKTDVQELQTDVKGLQTDVQELQTDMRGLKTDVQELQTDMKGLQTDVQELQTDVKGLQTDVQELQTDVENLEGDVQGLKKDTHIAKKRLKNVELMLENETNRNIRLIAEGHLDLSRKLDDALKVENEREMFILRLNSIEEKVNQLKPDEAKAM